MRAVFIDSGGFERVAYCVAGERKTDQGNGGADNHGGHDLIDPFDACKFYDDREDDVYETCEDRAEDDTGKALRGGYAAAKSGEHRAEECKGRTEEYRAFELGEQQINDRADAGSEECSRLAHAVAYNGGDGDRRGKDRKHLLECEDDHLAESGFVFYSVNKIHRY